jgi:hypothetical protein
VRIGQEADGIIYTDIRASLPSPSCASFQTILTPLVASARHPRFTGVPNIYASPPCVMEYTEITTRRTPPPEFTHWAQLVFAIFWTVPTFRYAIDACMQPRFFLRISTTLHEASAH